MRKSFVTATCVVAMVALLMGYRGVSFAQQKVAKEAGSEPSYKYDTSGIRLEGRLTECKVYGPPGYGETPAKDERATILILKLTRGITVEPLADAKAKDSANLDTVKGVHEVQLFVDRSQAAEAHKLVGNVVVVVGTLNEAVAPSQYTKVWLDTKTLNAK